MSPVNEWESPGPGISWGEVTPREHLVQIYEDDDVFLDTLAGFAGGGLRAGDGVIIIATGTHLEAGVRPLGRLGFRGLARRLHLQADRHRPALPRGSRRPATVRLEHLWQGICQTEGLSLFCAYPRSGFTQDASTSIQEICALHSRVVVG